MIHVAAIFDIVRAELLSQCRLFIKSLPRDSWVIWGSALGLIEEAVEFAAGRIEGALLLVRPVVERWAAVGSNHITKKLLGSDLPQCRVVVQVADDFSTQ